MHIVHIDSITIFPFINKLITGYPRLIVDN